MPNKNHFKIISQGINVWNQWRKENPAIIPDLSNANLRGAKLRGINFRNGYMAGIDLGESELNQASFEHADISGCANFNGASLFQANLNHAMLHAATFIKSNLTETFLNGADLTSTNFSEANLTRAKLFGAGIVNSNFSRSNLSSANLSFARLINVNFNRAILNNSFVFGISAWDLDLQGTKQANLIISRPNQPVISVDNIEIAQFIYLLLHNRKIREAIDTITTKVVLILGRFSPQRKKVLNSIRDSLRKNDFVPVLFDFPPLGQRDLTETVLILASMARFIIADLTDAKCIPQELTTVIPHLPSVPIQPILLSSEKEYSMFEHWRQYEWVLPVFLYKNEEHLIENLVEKVINPAKMQII